MASLRTFLLLCLMLISAVRAGTWLSFNDFKESGLEYPIRSNIGDIVDVCNEQQRRMQKRADEHRILTRAERENSDMCRFLMRMVHKSSGIREEKQLILSGDAALTMRKGKERKMEERVRIHEDENEERRCLEKEHEKKKS
ncbi:hypothetical protein Q1695_011324 [Nippostrongylus brasiliensis]|nr:hypothetical protein Q1695_011324 [Nippostrongylus brasiliensis]